MRRRILTAALVATLAAPMAPASAYQGLADVTTWDGMLAEGQSLQVRDLDIDRIRELDVPAPQELRSTTHSGDDTVISMQTDILFDFGSAKLNSNAAPILKATAEQIPPRATLRVWGYTDAVGDTAANLKLSTARAKAVAAQIKRSRPDLTLQTAGKGETKPVAPNVSAGKDNPNGRAKNRRVELLYRG